VRTGPRFTISRGLLTVSLALALLLVASAVVAPTSVSRSALLGMLPFAAVLAIVALGQTLVVQQGGIDLSVPGAVSLSVVITTHQPAGNDDRLLGAMAFGLAVAVAFGVVNGLLVGRMGLNPIVATLGTSALMYAMVLNISGGSPRRTTELLRGIAGGVSFGVPNSVYIALVVIVVASVAMKMTATGRRFEAIGANRAAAAAIGLPVLLHQAGAYVCAQVLYWLGGVLLSGIIAQPTCLPGRRLSAALGRGGRARRHLPSGRAGLSRPHRHRRAVPQPARTVRSRTGRVLCRTHAGRSRRSHGRSGSLQRRLALAPAAAGVLRHENGRLFDLARRLHQAVLQVPRRQDPRREITQ
jgi:ribose transport system permease protein